MKRPARDGLIGCLLLTVSLSGCGSSPPPLSVSGVSDSSIYEVASPAVTVEQIEGDDSHATAASEPDEDTTATPVVGSSPNETADRSASSSVATVDLKQLVGCWCDNYGGKRTITLNADGSATMLLELDLAGSLLYGKRLEFDLKWSLSESVLRFEIKSGRPIEATRSAIKMWGETLDYRLILVDHDNIHGWASDDVTLCKLRRVASPTKNEAEPRREASFEN